MTTYKETRILGMGALRSLCIKENWYTRGDSAAYGKLLRMADKDNITTQDIAVMAIDIKEHSNTDADITNIMFEISRKCFSLFDEV